MHWSRWLACKFITVRHNMNAKSLSEIEKSISSSNSSWSDARSMSLSVSLSVRQWIGSTPGYSTDSRTVHQQQNLSKLKIIPRYHVFFSCFWNVYKIKTLKFFITRWRCIGRRYFVYFVGREIDKFWVLFCYLLRKVQWQHWFVLMWNGRGSCLG